MTDHLSEVRRAAGRTGGRRSAEARARAALAAAASADARSAEAPPPGAPTAAPANTFRVLSTILRDGATLRPGGAVTFSDEEAESGHVATLVAAGVVCELDDPTWEVRAAALAPDERQAAARAYVARHFDATAAAADEVAANARRLAALGGDDGEAAMNRRWAAGHLPW
jgi:hypothetical protein